MPEYYIGTSGWHYEHWRELFYPVELPKEKWLHFYAGYFNTVELNNSFYRLPSEVAFINWQKASPNSFTYAVKVNRFITHIKRLRNVQEALQNFMSRVQLLGNKLGPLLYQLPPNMKRNEEVLEDFLALLPKSFRHAFEFRHESWLSDNIFDLLYRYNAGFCIYDMPGFTSPLVATADFAYIRFHGSAGLYWSCYTDEELSHWAHHIVELGKKLRAVYIYFNNDAEANAVKNALQLKEKLRYHSSQASPSTNLPKS